MGPQVIAKHDMTLNVARSTCINMQVMGSLGPRINLAKITPAGNAEHACPLVVKGMQRVGTGIQIINILHNAEQINDRFGVDDNDTVRGGVGADSMSGGTGSDTLSYTSDTVGVTVNLSSNTASGSNAAGETITSFESVKAGSGDNVLIGTIGANAIISRGGGDDLIRGNGGADTLNGGGGIDTLSYGTDTAGVSVDIGLNTASGGDAAGT